MIFLLVFTNVLSLGIMLRLTHMEIVRNFEDPVFQLSDD